MLLVKNFIAPSSVHGVGVYAAEPIAKGTAIWAWDDRLDLRFSAAELKALPEAARAMIELYGFPETFDDDADILLDGDHARFLNHSATPNTDWSGVNGVAIRDIAAGEEILTDYSQFYPPSYAERHSSCY